MTKEQFLNLKVGDIINDGRDLIVAKSDSDVWVTFLEKKGNALITGGKVEVTCLHWFNLIK